MIHDESIVAKVHQSIRNQYGFVADRNKPTLHNALRYIMTLPTWYYESRPIHSAYHNLSSSPMPANLKGLLGLGLKFCPTPPHRTTIYDLRSLPNGTIARIERDVELRVWFNNHGPDDDDDFDPALHISSNWQAPKTVPLVDNRLDRFYDSMKYIFGTKKIAVRSNLLGLQQRALKELKANPSLLVVACDKNLGPAVIERDQYIRFAFRDHLQDAATYRYLNRRERDDTIELIRYDIKAWLRNFQGQIKPSEYKFLSLSLDANKTPLPVFYLTFKVHKTPLKTRPIVSCSGSLLQPLGKWIDKILQGIASKQRSYFKSSFELKDELMDLELPAGSKIFTADAVSMYTNIPTKFAIDKIEEYLYASREYFPDIPIRALISALRLVMNMNVMDFGDTTWHQLNGTAMGTPPAPPYATLYYAIHEESFLDECSNNIFYYRRFIDDVFGIWTPSPINTTNESKWQDFQNTMNAWQGLEWTFSPRGEQVDFMDLRIRIDGNGLSTTLFEKELNLYLYLPPHSAHPPGVIKGLIYGAIYRIHRLCSIHADIATKRKQSYQRLLVRGWKPSILTPLYEQAIAHAKRTTPIPFSQATVNHAMDNIAPARTIVDRKENLFLHLPYNPGDPTAPKIHEAWKRTMTNPRNGLPIKSCAGFKKRKLLIGNLTIAYSRPRNLGSILSYRQVKEEFGQAPVSSFRGTDTEPALEHVVPH
jgi:hypothetical protein